MDVLNQIKSPVDGKSGRMLPQTRKFLGASGREFTNPFKKDFFNLSGQLLTDYNSCQAAYATYTANMTAYNNYLTAYHTWLTDYNAAGCGTTLTAPTAPTLQTKVTGTDPCSVAANAAADLANTNMNSAYNTAKAAYDAKVATCATKSAARPTVVSMPTAFSATNYITAGTSGSTPYVGFDGRNATGLDMSFGYRNAVGLDLSTGRKFSNATGLDLSTTKKYRNACAPCAAAAFLGAEGDTTSTSSKFNWMSVLVLVGGTILLWKIFLK